MTLEELKDFFSKDLYASKQTGIEIIEAGERYAKCKLVVNENHKNAVGQVMGGVYFTLADYTFAISTNTDKQITVTTTSQISYFKPMKGQIMFAESQCLKDGKTNCFYKIKIFDENDNLLAEVNTCGTHLN